MIARSRNGEETEAAPRMVLDRGLHDERGHIRAYERWVSILHGRACPSIEDLEISGMAGPCDVLIDLRRDPNNPELTCIGGALVADCGRRGVRCLSEVPSRSFLALLTARHGEVARRRCPVPFDGKRAFGRSQRIAYRGILLPLSSDGTTVDFIYGTISWREPADTALAAQIEEQAARAGMGAPPGVRFPALWPAGGEARRADCR